MRDLKKKRVPVVLASLIIGLAAVGLFATRPVMLQAAVPSGAHLAADLEFTPEVPIPGVFDETKTVTNNFIAEYIRAIYVYFIWTVGLLAMFMIVYGGVKWVSAAGNPGQINDARETINNAVIGVIIALTSVLLLNVINPNFVNLGLPDIATVQTEYFEGAYVPTVCQKELDTPCNALRLVDSSQDPKVYCLGAKCGADEVCSLTSVTRVNGTNSFASGLGCLKKIDAVYKTASSPEQPLMSRDGFGNITNITTMTVTDAQNGNPSCGYASAGIAITSFCPTNRHCYMTGLKAQFSINPISLGPSGTVGAGTIANNFNCSL